MAEYTIENFEDIKKVEFTSFEQNFEHDLGLQI